MGEPLFTGSPQLIETSSLAFAVVTVAGGSGLEAHSRVRAFESSVEYP